MEDPAFALTDTTIDINTQTILLHASNHDLSALKPLLRIPGNASVQDPETGFTPLHAAIAACGPAKTSSSESQSTSAINSGVEGGENENGEGKDADGVDEYGDPSKAAEVAKELFLSGAIWNDLDKENETPGCLAWRLGQKELYELCVNAGVRAEMLLGLMGGYEELESGDEEEDEIDGVEGEGEQGELEETNGHFRETASHELAIGPAEEELEFETRRDVNSSDYLKSELTFSEDKLLDADANGVMMAWETDIMRRTVDLLIPDFRPGLRILNIGFGMGIIDQMFRDTKPLSHHIIEAHPSVLSHLSSPSSDFGTEWSESASTGGEYIIHAGKWQDILPNLLEQGEVFDIIYFDTFGELYSELKHFFTDFVPGLLDGEGKFGFFNGLGADRRVCYDVYCKVVELDLCDAGLDVEWADVEVAELGGEGEGEWKGVRRRYWTLDKYRLPICTFLG
jgi:protein arginine N-methyltransferase 2